MSNHSYVNILRIHLLIIKHGFMRFCTRMINSQLTGYLCLSKRNSLTSYFLLEYENGKLDKFFLLPPRKMSLLSVGTICHFSVLPTHIRFCFVTRNYFAHTLRFLCPYLRFPEKMSQCKNKRGK